MDLVHMTWPGAFAIAAIAFSIAIVMREVFK